MTCDERIMTLAGLMEGKTREVAEALGWSWKSLDIYIERVRVGWIKQYLHSRHQQS